MSHTKRRWGGKLGGNHPTVIEAAWRFLPDVIKEKSVTKISPGFITAGKTSTGRNAVKIIDEKGNILLSVRGPSVHQEIRVFTDDMQKAKLAIARAARNAEFHISFGTRLPAP
ncbi:MAG: DUF2103 domain-containing protein [bacterium]